MTSEQLTIPQFYSFLDETYRSGAVNPLHVFLVASDVEVKGLADLARAAGVYVSLREKGERVHEVTLRLRKRSSRGFIVAQYGILNFLIESIGGSTAAYEVASRCLAHLFPELARLYLDSNQLLGLLDYLNGAEGEHTFHILDYMLLKQRRSTSRQWEKGKPYDRRILEGEMEKNNAILDSIHFRFSADRSGFNARVSRNGHFVFYGGVYSDLTRLLILPAIEKGLANIQYFSKRQRDVVKDEVVIKPIHLEGTFTKDDLGTLLDTLCDTYSTAILRTGNPWFLAQAIDQSDGSSFDVYGYENEILVIPFSKAREASLVRLYSIISETLPSSKPPRKV